MGDSRLSTVDSRPAASPRNSPTNTARPPSLSTPDSAATTRPDASPYACTRGTATTSSPTSAPAPDTTRYRVLASGSDVRLLGMVPVVAGWPPVVDCAPVV